MTRQFQRNRTKMLKALKRELKRFSNPTPINLFGELQVNLPDGGSYTFPWAYCVKLELAGERLSLLKANYTFTVMRGM